VDEAELTGRDDIEVVTVVEALGEGGTEADGTGSEDTASLNAPGADTPATSDHSPVDSLQTAMPFAATPLTEVKSPSGIRFKTVNTNNIRSLNSPATKRTSPPSARSK